MKKFTVLLIVMVLLVSAMVGCFPEKEEPKDYCDNCGDVATQSIIGVGDGLNDSGSTHFCESCWEDYKREHNTQDGGVFQ